MSEKELNLINDIYRFGKKQHLLKATGCLTYFFIIMVILWLSLVLADSLFYFSSLTRWGLWFIHTTIIVYLVKKFIFNPWLVFFSVRPDSDLTSIAATISQFFPNLKDSLLNTYHLITQRQASAISESLRSAAVANYLKRLSDYDFKKKLQFSDYLPASKITLPVLLSVVILVSFKFERISHSTLRMLNPANEYLKIPPYLFKVQPGSIKILKGQKVGFEVLYQGPELSTCLLLFRMPENEKNLQSFELNYFNGKYVGELNDVRESFNYQIEGVPRYEKQFSSYLCSPEFRVEVLQPPWIKTIDVTLIPPAYTGLTQHYLERNIGDIVALPGTRVKLKGAVNKTLSSAKIKFGSGKVQELQINDLRISCEFYVKQEDTYHIELSDTLGLQNLDPIEYKITTSSDNPPFIEISEPGQDIESRLDATLALTIEASDDFGLSEVALYYKYLRNSKSASDTNWQKISFGPISGRQKQQNLSHFWDFNTLPLAFDDGLMYFAQANDNNTVNGPGVSKTNPYYIRFPSLEELFDAINEKENEQIEKVEDIVKQSAELKETLEKINLELKRAEQLEWEHKQQLQNSLEKQKNLQEQLQDIQKELEELINQLETNDLISEAVLEKYRQLQELFKEIATAELLEALAKLQNALEKADPRDIKQALQEFKLNQEIFQERIERTMELLRQVQMEQRMDQLVQKAKNLWEQQEKISAQLKAEQKLTEEDFKQLEGMQKQQEEKANNLKQDIADFLNEPRLNKFPETMQSLDSALQQLNNRELAENYQELSQNLKAGQQQKSSPLSERLQSQFQQLSHTLSSAQNQLLEKTKNELQQKMQQALNRLLELSHYQELINTRTQKLSPLDDNFKDITIAQGRIRLNLQKVISELIQLSKETFFIKPGLSKSLGKSQSGMTKSLDELSERNKSQALQNQTIALGGLNESIMELHQSMSQLAQSQSGTGFEQFLEQIQQVTGGQGQLNQETLDLFQGQANSGQLSLQQQGEIRRLASQQAALREALEKISEQMGSRQDVMGRIGELAGKMDEVVQDLIQQNVNRETIHRQREILSRLLDAQKSVQEREFSQKRKAEVAKDYNIIDPKSLRNLTDLEKKKLQDALKRALNEGYQSDYQKLIEAYFNQLIKQQNEKN